MPELSDQPADFKPTFGNQVHRARRMCTHRGPGRAPPRVSASRPLWGDADVHFNKTVVPDNGFTVIDSILLEGALVQCAVAVRQVSAAGTYRVTWSATPVQGAQLWIAAVQSSS